MSAHLREAWHRNIKKRAESYGLGMAQLKLVNSETTASGKTRSTYAVLVDGEIIGHIRAAFHRGRDRGSSPGGSTLPERRVWFHDGPGDQPRSGYATRDEGVEALLSAITKPGAY